MENLKKASSKDVATLAGVSRATVSAYLNKTRYVSPELSEKIQKAIDDLNYIPDPLARALKTQDSKAIGLIIPVMSKFFTPLIKVINSYCQENDYDLIISSSEENPEIELKLINMLLAKRFSGLLIAPCSSQNAEMLLRVKGQGLPVVQVNRRIDGLDISSVVSDSYGAAYEATKMLVDKGSGKIIYFGYDERMLTNLEKKKGYDQALVDSEIDEHLCIKIHEHDTEHCVIALNDFIDSGKEFDGLIAASQGKTAIALQVLKERGIRIPDQVRMIGFDDSVWSSLCDPPLTVVSESTQEMGQRAVELLMKSINSDEPAEVTHLQLTDELIQRNSV